MLLIVTLVWTFLVNTIFVQAGDEWGLGLLKIGDNNTSVPYYLFDNAKAKIAGAFDYTNRLESFFDGRNGALFLWRYEKSIAYYFPQGVWYADSQNFTDFLRETNLEDLYERRSEAYKCRPPMIPPGFSKHLADVLKYIIEEFSSKCQAFSTVIWMSKTTSDEFLTSLSGLENLIGEILFAPSGIDLESIVGLFQGLGDIFKHFDGLVEYLIRRNAKLDFVKIVNEASRSGFHVISELIEVFSSYSVNLNSLRRTFNNQYSFFVLIRKLGGDKNGGSGIRNPLKSFIYTIVDVMSVIKGELSLSNLRATLKIYYEIASGDVDIEKQWRQAVKILLQSIKKLKLEKKFENLVKLLQDILDEKWRFNGVDMSWISKFLFWLKEANKNTPLKNEVNYFLKNLDKKIQAFGNETDN